MPEIKKGKIIKCVYNREFKSQFGLIYYFNLEFDNGDAGEMSTNKVDVLEGRMFQNKFSLVKEVEYTTEEKTASNGRKYIKIDRPPKDSSYTGASNASSPKRRRIARSVSLEIAIRYKNAFLVKTNLFLIMEEAYKWIETKGEDEASNITAQASLKYALLTLEKPMADEVKEEYGEFGAVLKIADKYFEQIMA